MVTAMKVKPGMIDYCEIDRVDALTTRVQRLRQRRQDAVEHICAERSRIVTESWKRTEGEPLDIRRAKLFRDVMRENPVVIRDDELIVGGQSKYILGASPFVDYSPEAAYENLVAEDVKQSDGMKATGGSSVKEAAITEEERRSILEDCRFWSGRSAGDAVKREEEARFPWLRDWIESGLVLAQQTGSAPPAVRSADHSKVISIGLEGIIAEAKQELAGLEYRDNPAADYKKDRFLRAAIIACEGAIEYAQRYARLAREMAAEEQEPRRKKELERIADVCDRVPAKPARDFYEAVQSFWFIHLCLNLETASIAEMPGRLDQHLYPLYHKDVIEEGKLTRQDAAELLGCLFVKFNEMTTVKVKYDKENIPGTHLQDLTVCGVHEDGTDASNELSYLLLEVLAQIEMPQPPVYVRYHNNINRALWMKAVEVNVRRGDGNPSFVNDGSRILSLTAHGVSLQDARDWAVAGCAGSITPRCSMHGGNLGIVYINLAKIFEYVLNDGKDPKTGKQIGLRTGDPRDFESMDDFVDAFKKQFDHLVAIFMKMVRMVCFVEVDHYRTPFVSALLGDCLKNGMDAREGGVRYTQFLYHISDRGLQNVADSLAAVKRIVFEDKRASLTDVLGALSSDFTGDAALQAMLRSAPKYGNDDDYVDDIFGELSVWLQHRIGMEKNPFGSSLWAGRSGAVAHVEFGKKVGALPDGRKAGEPLADGYLSPSQGVDVEGPTAVFNSASKVDHNENSFAALMNMKFDRNVINTRDKLVKLADMVATFFHRGGFHIQINILDRQTLLDAQRRPEAHKNLMVRVAGYSAYYVDLPRGLQDEILARSDEAL